MSIYPVQYQPSNGVLKYYSEFTLVLETEKCEVPNWILSYRSLEFDDYVICNSVDNPEYIKNYHIQGNNGSQSEGNTSIYDWITLRFRKKR